MDYSYHAAKRDTRKNVSPLKLVNPFKAVEVQF